MTQAMNKSSTRHVLVVDDEPLIRWSLAETLGAEGYRVSEAGDGASAIRAFTAEPGTTDVVLLDLRLPDSDDLRVLRTLHRLSPMTPVILMTAYGTPEVLDEARRIGAFTVIQKPFEMGDIGPIVDRAMAARAS